MIKVGPIPPALLLPLAFAVACADTPAEEKEKPVYGSTATPDPPSLLTDAADVVQDGAKLDSGDGSDAAGATDGAGDTTEGDDGAADAGDAASIDAPPPQDGAAPDAGPPGDGSVGSPCNLDADCADEGAVCLDLPGGYCTILDCVPGGEGCPEGTECHLVKEGVAACLSSCEAPEDCRPGYPCKRLIRPDGTFSRACHAEAKDAGGPAALCSFPDGCDGEATCLGFLPGGYCAVVGCGEGVPCPSKASCVSMGEYNACLRDCDGANPCPGSAAKLQSCQEVDDVQQEPVSVCLTGASGKTLGELCAGDLECLSKHCTVYAEGRCTPGGEELCVTDDDCSGSGGICEIKPDYHVAICTQPCDGETPCPEGAVCVPSSATEGQCQLECGGLGDIYTCDDLLSQQCLYGDELGAETVEGTFACVSTPEGQMGAGCDTGEEGPGCAGDGGVFCYQGTGSAGYCTGPCGDQGYCPWSMVCGSTGVNEQCLLRCTKKIDCPAGFDCVEKPVTTGVQHKLCFPE